MWVRDWRRKALKAAKKWLENGRNLCLKKLATKFCEILKKYILIEVNYCTENEEKFY